MVQLIERMQALQNPNLKRVIGGLQNAFYQDWINMAATHQEKLLVEERFDCRESQPKPEYCMVKVFYHPSDQLLEYPLQVGKAIQVALQSLGVTSVFCLAYLKTPLFGNLRNRYLPLKKAYRNLKLITKNTNYREGFQVEVESLAYFMEILFWISRCDMAAPEYIFLNPESDYFVSNFCKYGNLHTEFYDSQLETHVCDKLIEAGLKEWQGQEYDRFSQSGLINGRRLKV